MSIDGRALAFSAFVFFWLALLTFMPVAWADDDVVSVFDVRKSLPLEPTEPVYHDIYLNGGPESGLKKGMYVSILRKTPIHDPVQNKAQAVLGIEVARVHIIHTEHKISVARVAQQYSGDDRPVLEYEGVMIGDVLDLSSVSMDPPKELRKKRTPAQFGSADATAATAPVPAPPSQASERRDPPPTTVTIPIPAPPKPKAPEAQEKSSTASPTARKEEFPEAFGPGMVQPSYGDQRYI